MEVKNLSKEYQSFFNREKQLEIYKKLEIENSVEEINLKLFIKENQFFFNAKKNNKDNKDKGVKLNKNNVLKIDAETLQKKI